MASIREKGPFQWSVQIRRKGWPNQSATFRTKKDAQAWARKIESEMDRSQFVDQSAGRQVTLGDLIRIYKKEVTAQRPGEDSRIAESSRLDRFLRTEAALCAYAVANLTPEHFEDYRDRRLAQRVGSTGKTIAPGTVRRELTLLKRVIDHRKRRLGLAAARQKFLDPDEAVRREALEYLWEAYEWLKEFGEASRHEKHKENKRKAILDAAAGSKSLVFRDVLDREMREIERIAEVLQVRRGETGKEPVAHKRQVDYLFRRLMALVQILSLQTH
jgi:hypothetical protein